MFPYYLLPNAGDTQKPDAEEELESQAPLAVDPALQDYENNLYSRLGLTPPHQPVGSGSSQPTKPPPVPVDTGVQDYENNLYHRLGPPPPKKADDSTGGPSARGRGGASDNEDEEILPPDIETKPYVDSEQPTGREDWRDTTPLTYLQAEHVDHLLTEETDPLAREVLIALKRDGLPPRSEWNDFMAQYALFSWDAESDAQAWATLALIAESDWDETTAYADEDHVEVVAQDLGDNAIEGLVVIDAETRDTLFDRTGVVRGDGSQYVGMQDTEADALRAEALSGRKLIFVHNHTEEIGASDEDRDSAFAAGAKLLIVITQQGQEYVYIRGRYTMVEVRDEKASYEVGLENPEETEELRIRSEAQAWAFQHDSPELIFLQEERGI